MGAGWRINGGGRIATIHAGEEARLSPAMHQEGMVVKINTCIHVIRVYVRRDEVISNQISCHSHSPRMTTQITCQCLCASYSAGVF